ncbi:MAG: threonine synthase [Bacillota bacterium]|nr:threonine synthase [Bacillota bacterium]
MNYKSTRGSTSNIGSAEAIIRGLAPDGGLFVPAENLFPFDLEKIYTRDYQTLAKTIFNRFLTDFNSTDLENAISGAYERNNFTHYDITPIKKVSDNLFYLELWHGPTCAFKDIALQVLPYLLHSALKVTGTEKEIVILTATSGDTGKSALEGFRDKPGVKILVYYPQNGVSEIQKLQMTTQEGSNLSVAAVRGNFDDTQKGVKEIFNNAELADFLYNQGYSLSSANSINWGRLLPQIVYYFYAYFKLIAEKEIVPGSKINFIVPTGNFGNILAGYYARQLGLPVNRLICASNRNNVLSEFINTGSYMSNRPLYQTNSPSMDILVSSNLERLLFELAEHESDRINRWMNDLKIKGEYKIDSKMLSRLQELFWSDFADDAESLAEIAITYRDHNYLIDTHTAVATSVYRKYHIKEADSAPAVILSTASPFKFTGSVVEALFGKEKYHKYSELELVSILASETGTSIPASLSNLGDRVEIYKQVITPNEMNDHLLEFLKLQV